MYEDLIALSQLQYQRSQAKLKFWVERETMLREKFAALRTSANSQTDNISHKLSGLDVQWERWLEQRQSAINTELARCLAQKESAKSQVKQAFGRNECSHLLRDIALKKIHQNKVKRGEITLFDLMIQTRF